MEDSFLRTHRTIPVPHANSQQIGDIHAGGYWTDENVFVSKEDAHAEITNIINATGGWFVMSSVAAQEIGAQFTLCDGTRCSIISEASEADVLLHNSVIEHLGEGKEPGRVYYRAVLD